MKPGQHVHRITAVDVLTSTGTCSRCGSGTPIRSMRMHKGRPNWACYWAVRLAGARSSAKQGGYAPPDIDCASELAAMYRKAGGICGICGKTNPLGLHLDHDHATGEVRGFLCGTHNRGVGMFGNDPVLLRAAADYLERGMI